VAALAVLAWHGALPPDYFETQIYGVEVVVESDPAIGIGRLICIGAGVRE
jgi:hypothetical protein